MKRKKKMKKKEDRIHFNQIIMNIYTKVIKKEMRFIY